MKTALVNGFLPDSFTRFSPFPSVSVVPLTRPPSSSFFFLRSLSPTFIFSPSPFSLSSFIPSLPPQQPFLSHAPPSPAPVSLALQTASSCFFSLSHLESFSLFSSFNQPVAGQVVARRVTTPRFPPLVRSIAPRSACDTEFARARREE